MLTHPVGTEQIQVRIYEKVICDFVCLTFLKTFLNRLFTLCLTAS